MADNTKWNWNSLDHIGDLYMRQGKQLKPRCMWLIEYALTPIGVFIWLRPHTPIGVLLRGPTAYECWSEQILPETE